MAVTAEEPPRCEWVASATLKLAPGCRCMETAGHERGHVVVAFAGLGEPEVAAWFYRVDPVTETASAVLHLDLRGPTGLDDEEAYAVFQYMTFVGDASRRG
jgi:hypothetical protein